MVESVRRRRRLIRRVCEQNKRDRLCELFRERVVKNLEGSTYLASQARIFAQDVAYQRKHPTRTLHLVGAGGDLLRLAFPMPVDVLETGGVDLVNSIALAVSVSGRLWACFLDGWGC